MGCSWVIFAGTFMTLLAPKGYSQDVRASWKSVQVGSTCQTVYSTEPCPQNSCTCPPCPACICQCYQNNVTAPDTPRPTQGGCTQDGTTDSGSVAGGCDVLYKSGVRANGVYVIDPDGGGQIEVYCDMEGDGGGWTIFQRRQDGTVDFYRDWNAYKAGFGDPREYWLGLDQIHRLTTAKPMDLRVTVADSGGTEKFARYRGFRVDGEDTNYTLRLGLYLEGSAGDSLEYHRDMAFSTADRDNDNSADNCAEEAKGAWWFKDCHHTSDLNGAYHGGPSQSINWYSFSGDNVPLARAEMRLRPSDF